MAFAGCAERGVGVAPRRGRFRPSLMRLDSDPDVIATIEWVGLSLLRRSRCAATISPQKQPLMASPAIPGTYIPDSTLSRVTPPATSRFVVDATTFAGILVHHDSE